MSFTRTDSHPRAGAVVAVVVIHLLMFYAISSGLNVTKIAQPLESMVTIFVPQEKPAEPPPAQKAKKIPDAKLEEVIPEPDPVATEPPVDAAESVPIEAPQAVTPESATFSIKHRIDPLYPSASRRAGEQGTVLLELIVGADGRPIEVNVLRSSGYPLLDQAAIDAVRKWRFTTHESGSARLQLPVTFKLENR